MAALIPKQLKNIDDIFLLNGQLNIVDMDVEKLTPFENQPFKMYGGERMDDMVESIKQNGVLTPIIIRPKANSTLYEILAGRHRWFASKLAGRDTVPAILLENISDDEAMVYVVETNLMQRSFSEMSHSEKVKCRTLKK